MAHERLGLATALAFCAWAMACTVESGGNGFGSASGTQTASVGTTVPNDDSGSEGSSSDTGGSTGGSGSSGGGSTDGGTGSTSMTTGDPTLDGSSSGAVDPTDGQPADGMWSMCLAAVDCGNLPILCIQSVDAMMMPIDGFCSEIDCVNAAVDCLPAPGGTAMPACAPITVNDVMEQACVLNCAGGLICPTGMVCMNFTGLGMICM